MIAMTLDEVASVTGGAVVPEGYGDVVVSGPVVTDSRQAAAGGMYVARVGEHADGHAYVGSARDAGAVAALAAHPVPELPAVVVDDVQLAFGRLGRAVVDRARSTAGLRIVAVTGSSGKTSTKDLLAQVLATAGPTVAPENSLNGEIGVPLTVCRVTDTTRFLVAEMGARGIGHLTYLAAIAPPDVSVVLNVGSAHVGEFGSRENIARAKGELVQALSADGVAVLNADDAAVAGMAALTSARVVTVGTRSGADVTARDVRLDAVGRATFTLESTLSGGPRSAPVALRVAGAHQVGNALSAAAAALVLGLPLDQVAAGLGAAAPLSRWRMEVTERPDGVTVVNDAYNANPESMRAALQALSAIAAAGGPAAARRRTYAVLGQMLELGDQAQEGHRFVGREAVATGVDELVVVGEGAAQIAEGALAAAPGSGPRVRRVADTDAAYDVLSDELRAGDVVLLKSSRDAGLRWLGDRLAGLEVPS